MRTALCLASLVVGVGCGTTPAGDPADNPFTQNMDNDGKEDSAYLNPDGAEVEVDIEGDAVGPAGQLTDAPAVLAQYATTVFRKAETMYIESVAEDATAADRAEWQVNGTWYTSDKLPAGAALKHWRLRGMNTVLLFSASKTAKVGQTFTAKAPLKPFSVFADAGKTCADSDDHIGLDESVYWYRWEPKASCKIPQQDLQVTVSKTFAKTQASVYPEFDQLVADKKLTVVIMFGEIDDGPITANETGMQSFTQYGTWLKAAKFVKAANAPLGERYEKTVNGTLVQIDLYSPREFSGLDDYGHFANFQKALSEHEIVTWDGHSMLGASDFWARPTYPGSYQIFLYGGCLGYEYYVKPILHGKGDSWAKLDIMSSVVEVSATANEFAAPAIAKIVWALDHGYKASWKQILTAVRNSVGDSTFGVSGVRDNKFKP